MPQVIIDKNEKTASLTVMGDEMAFWFFDSYTHDCQKVTFYQNNKMVGYVQYSELDDIIINGSEDD